MPRALLACCLLLGACAGPLPEPDPQRAWVDIYTTPGNVLLAERLDQLPVKDGRYYQLTPGAHQLQLRLQFELPGGNGLDHSGGGSQRTCLFGLDYAGFQAGQHYRVNAGQQGYRGWVRLYDAQRQLLARGRELRCGAL
jgi:hypothetical protein